MKFLLYSMHPCRCENFCSFLISCSSLFLQTTYYTYLFCSTCAEYNLSPLFCIVRKSRQWVGDLASLSSHLSDCGYVPESCQYCGVFLFFGALSFGELKHSSFFLRAQFTTLLSLLTPLRSAITAQRGGIVNEISILFYSIIAPRVFLLSPCFCNYSSSIFPRDFSTPPSYSPCETGAQQERRKLLLHEQSCECRPRPCKHCSLPFQQIQLEVSMW